MSAWVLLCPQSKTALLLSFGRADVLGVTGFERHRYSLIIGGNASVCLCVCLFVCPSVCSSVCWRVEMGKIRTMREYDTRWRDSTMSTQYRSISIFSTLVNSSKKITCILFFPNSKIHMLLFYECANYTGDLVISKNASVCPSVRPSVCLSFDRFICMLTHRGGEWKQR